MENQDREKAMNILVTGSDGFIGKNLVANLKNIKEGKNKTRPGIYINEIYVMNKFTSPDDIECYCRNADIIFHFAGVNRVKDDNEYWSGNVGLLELLLKVLKKQNSHSKFMFASSVQATLLGRYEESVYGKSKRACEKLLMDYRDETGSEIYIYRFPNVFGKWCRPNYNSVVATLCDAIANNKEYKINNPKTKLELLYIDDLLEEMYDCLEGKQHHCHYMGMDLIPSLDGDFCFVPKTYHVSLKSILDLLLLFKQQPATLIIPSVPEGSFVKKLYSTYLSYLSPEDFRYSLKMNTNENGSFTELFRSVGDGQLSVNVSYPKVVKGQHWHNSKWEIFVVVSGRAKIQMRKYDEHKIYEFEMSGDKMESLLMVPGYVHNLINESDTEKLVTLIWANEAFNPDKPDTFREYVSD